MSRRVLLTLVALAVACSGARAPTVANDTREPPRALPEDFLAFERDYIAYDRRVADVMRGRGKEISEDAIATAYRDIFISGSGIVVERKLVSTFAELDRRRTDVNAAIDAVVRRTEADSFLGVALDLRAEPPAIALAALRLFAAKRKVTLFRIANDEVDTVCVADITTRPDHSTPTLSIALDGDRIWLATSPDDLAQIVPFEGRPDYERLHGSLGNDAIRPFVRDNDVELSAERASTS